MRSGRRFNAAPRTTRATQQESAPINPETATSAEFERWAEEQEARASRLINGSKDDADEIREYVQAMREKRQQKEAQH